MVFAPVAIAVSLIVLAAILAHLYIIRDRTPEVCVVKHSSQDLLKFDTTDVDDTTDVHDTTDVDDITSKIANVGIDVCPKGVKRIIKTPALEKHGYPTLVVRNVARRSKGEEKCKEIADRYFNADFVTVRPPFLMGEMNLAPMEYDLFACVDISGENIPIAIEFNGQQHYKLSKAFHSSPEDFQKQQERDNEKKKISVRYGVNLISVHYNHYYRGTIENFLNQEFLKISSKVSELKSYI